MQQIILKYPLAPFEEFNVPPGKVVAVNKQNDLPTVWIAHEWIAGAGVAEGNKSLSLRAFATGEVIPEDWQHVETVFVNAFVWHVYVKVVE